jgi:glutamate formiminotransferase
MLRPAIIECVPNFSEGRDVSIVDQIANAIRKVVGVKLLHVDMGYDANRTVMTFAGSPEDVVSAAYEAINVASQLIDMAIHSGAHPRIGATDVCPLIPVDGITMNEVISLSKELAYRVGNSLKIPVFLYEESSKLHYRKQLEDIRRGEYEGLPQKITQSGWLPDYGPYAFNARSGATIIGARNFLIAYNINLSTKDVWIAKKIASLIRSKSQSNMRLSSLKAIGWYMDEYDCCQVSTNLTNYLETNLHDVYERCKTIAKQMDIEVTGSELIGLVPMDAMVKSGKFYDGTNDNPVFLVNKAVSHLGLNTVDNFKINERIIEFALEDKIV